MYERQEAPAMADLAEKPHNFKRTKLMIFPTIGTATCPKKVLY